MVEGLRPLNEFNHRLEYGNCWHICEEAHAAGALTREPTWEHALADYCGKLLKRYPTQAQQVDHWWNVCRTQFPIYVDYWAQHPDVMERRPLLQEYAFNVPYRLPSGRTVRLRGKLDSVDWVKGKESSIWLVENKTKGDVREAQIKRQLSFDLQVMMYVVALAKYKRLKTDPNMPDLGFIDSYPIAGVRYNVVRRPLSGSKGSIKRHKPSKKNPAGEGKDAFYRRLGGIIKTSPAEYFMRWEVLVLPEDVTRFRRECLDPILEGLCDWWAYIQDHRGEPFKNPELSQGLHWRTPFGWYDPLQEVGSTDLDDYISTGSNIGLMQTNNLFPELT